MSVQQAFSAPSTGRGGELADWLEATLLVTGVTEVSREQVADLLARGLPEEPGYYEPEDGPALDDPDMEELLDDDPRLDQLLESVQERSELWPTVYPFRVDEDLFSREVVPGLAAYATLLWPSLPGTPMRLDRDWDRLEDAFDNVCALALESLLGGKVQTLRFAERVASDTDADVRPLDFDKAVVWLQAQIRCRRRDPVQLPAADEEAYPARTYKDGGVDIVAWREFADQRPGFPVVFAQCTIQASWRNKVHDVDLGLWTGWINFHTPPQRVLCIPYLTRPGVIWFDRNKQAGLVLDRYRLCELLEEAPNERLETVLSSADLELLHQELEFFGPD